MTLAWEIHWIMSNVEMQRRINSEGESVRNYVLQRFNI
jgi:hypothetical protein